MGGVKDVMIELTRRGYDDPLHVPTEVMDEVVAQVVATRFPATPHPTEGPQPQRTAGGEAVADDGTPPAP